MNNDYNDIRELIPSNPVWFDEHAVPRYCEFHPQRLASVYAAEAALVAIECQGCRTRFLVAFSEVNLAGKLWDESRTKQMAFLSDLIADGMLHYGDPPNIRCCAAGPTMNSIPIEVVEYWYRPSFKRRERGPIQAPVKWEWERDTNFHGPIRQQAHKPTEK